MRRLATAALVLVFLPYLLGASITLSITTNPNNTPSKIKGNGIWTLGAGETFGGSIPFDVTLKNSNPAQDTIANADRGFDGTNNTWESTLTVAAATYSPVKVTLNYLNNRQQAMQVIQINNEDWKVN